MWRSPKSNALGPRVFELQRPQARTLYIGEDSRPKSLKDQVEIELENATIFNSHTDLCVIDGSRERSLERNTKVLRSFVKKYGATIVLLTAEEWLSDLKMYRDFASARWQQALDNKTIDSDILKLLKEQELIDESSHIDKDKLLKYFIKNVFKHISGLRNYTVLVAKGERSIMLFDDDAPRETFVLHKEEREKIRANRLARRATEEQAMIQEIADRLKQPITTLAQVYVALANLALRAKVADIEEKYFAYNPDENTGLIPQAMDEIMHESSQYLEGSRYPTGKALTIFAISRSWMPQPICFASVTLSITGPGWKNRAAHLISCR